MGEIGSVLEGPADSRNANFIGNSRAGGYQHPCPRPTVCNSTYHNSVCVCIDPCFCIEKPIDIAGDFGILDGNVGSVVDGGDLGVVGTAVGVGVVGAAVDTGMGAWVDGEEDAMVAEGPIGGAGGARGGRGVLDTRNTGGKERSIEEVGGTVEVWTHRWSSGNGGNCRKVGGSIIDTVSIDTSIDSISNLFAESLIDKRMLMCFGQFAEVGFGGIDRACVGFDRSCYVADVESSHDRNRQSTNKTTTTTTTVNDNGTFGERLEFWKSVGRSGRCALGVGECTSDRNVEGFESSMSSANTTTTQRRKHDNDDNNDDSTTSHAHAPSHGSTLLPAPYGVPY